MSAPQSAPPDPERGDVVAVSLTSFHVDTTISFRYSRTEVTARYTNPGTRAHTAVFNMVLPKSAFISNFSMNIKDEEYVADVKEKEEAKKTYDEAVASGASAGLVSKNKRDSNVFSVDTNLEPGEKVTFSLTYDELLEREDGQYEYVLNINPGEVLEDFLVTVNINESLPLSELSVPELLQSNELDFTTEESQSRTARVTRGVDGSPNNARVEFSPSKEEQLEAGHQGVAGKFVVRYDVDRQGQDSEVQVIDGYFVHYFVPSDLPTLPKHVIFVLDTSGSMSGEKIQQLKDAMFTVLDDLTETDYFNIIEFNDDIKHWNGEGFDESHEETYQATENTKSKAISSVLKLAAGGGTNLNDAILAGLKVAQSVLEREVLPSDVKSMVVFLTDGLGSTDNEIIKSNIKTENRDVQVPVFTIAFGADTDSSLLQSIASQNNALFKRIYEGSDAALQLEDFYGQISSPLLSDLKFEYVGGLENSSLSQTEVNTFFKRREFIVTGKLSESDGSRPTIGVDIFGVGKNRLEYHRKFDICLRSSSARPERSVILPATPAVCLQPREYPKSPTQNFLQKLFAFQHIKQILKKEDTAETEEEKERLREKAKELSLENNFVTDVTSLVVIKPDEDPKVTTLTDSASNRQSTSNYFSQLPYSYTSPYSYGYNQGVVGVGGTSGSLGSLVGASVSLGSLRNSASYSGSGFRRRRPFGSRNRTSSLSNSSTTLSPPSRNTTSSLSNSSTAPSQLSRNTTDVGGECEAEGGLTLYSKTYHRGDRLELTDSQPDLTHHQFAVAAVSALVSGQCCWQVFSQANYAGKVTTLQPGTDYTSVTSLGELFRNVRAVRKVAC